MNRIKSGLAVLLVLVMVLTMMPLTAFAGKAYSDNTSGPVGGVKLVEIERPLYDGAKLTEINITDQEFEDNGIDADCVFRVKLPDGEHYNYNDFTVVSFRDLKAVDKTNAISSTLVARGIGKVTVNILDYTSWGWKKIAECTITIKDDPIPLTMTKGESVTMGALIDKIESYSFVEGESAVIVASQNNRIISVPTIHGNNLTEWLYDSDFREDLKITAKENSNDPVVVTVYKGLFLYDYYNSRGRWTSSEWYYAKVAQFAVTVGEPAPVEKTQKVSYQFTGKDKPENIEAPTATDVTVGAIYTIDTAYNKGDVVNGYVFSGWEVDNNNGNDKVIISAQGTFEMPNKAVNLKGSWKKAAQKTVAMNCYIEKEQNGKYSQDKYLGTRNVVFTKDVAIPLTELGKGSANFDNYSFHCADLNKAYQNISNNDEANLQIKWTENDWFELTKIVGSGSKTLGTSSLKNDIVLLYSGGALVEENSTANIVCYDWSGNGSAIANTPNTLKISETEALATSYVNLANGLDLASKNYEFMGNVRIYKDGFPLKGEVEEKYYDKTGQKETFFPSNIENLRYNKTDNTIEYTLWDYKLYDTTKWHTFNAGEEIYFCYAPTNPPAAQNVTLTFDANGGMFDGNSALTTTTAAVEKGKTFAFANVDEPTKATADNTVYKFEGWSITSDGAIGGDGFYYPNDELKVEDSMKLYAVWSEQKTEPVIPKVNVSFDANGGILGDGSGLTTTNVAIKKGTTIAAIEPPVFSGHTFTGWYLNDANEPFNFNNVIEGDTALIAHWTIDMSVSAENVEEIYDGTPHQLGEITVTANNNPVAANIKFWNDKVNQFDLENCPKQQLAGQIEVQFEATADGYTTTTGSATITILQREITVAAISSTIPYDGNNHQVGACELIGGTLAPGQEITSAAAVDIEAKLPGEYPVKVGAVTIGDSVDNNLFTNNYKINTANGILTIAAIDMSDEVSAQDYNGTYDGGFHGIGVNVPADAQVAYLDGENKNHYRNPGNYEVNYEVTQTGYTTVTGSAFVNISSAALTITAGSNTFSYNGSAQTYPTYSAVNLKDGDVLAYVGFDADSFVQYRNESKPNKATDAIILRPAKNTNGEIPASVTEMIDSMLAAGKSLSEVVGALTSEENKDFPCEDVTGCYDIDYVDGVLNIPAGSSSRRNKDTTPATEIIDENTPLAELPLLNSTDHFNYIKGYADGTVKPTNSITREEVATIFYRLLSDETRALYQTSEETFIDVEDGRWSQTAIATLAKAGILDGYNDGTFAPTKAITRAEFAKVCATFDELSPSDKDMFTDISTHWAKAQINSANIKGWIGGYTDGTFKPNQNITRAEVATMINKMLNRKVNAEGLLDTAKAFTDNTSDMWYYFDILEAANNHNYESRASVLDPEKWTEVKAEKVWN